MAKGSGGGGRGGKLGTVSVRGRSASELFGSAPGTMREGSFKFLRSGGKADPKFPVTLTKTPDGKIRGTDGRHRITLAREAGQKSIQGMLRILGPRGGEKRRKVKILL